VRLVAVTSCPTGIAHTYMAAESLEQGALAAGHEIAVEAQGAAGCVPLAADTIAAADAVILAADVEVRGRERFAGKPTVSVGVRRAITDAPGLLEQAVVVATTAARAAAPASASLPVRHVDAGTSGAVDPEPASREPESREPVSREPVSREPAATHVRRWLMTGVGHMVPFVAAGGILISLSFLLAQLAGNGGAVALRGTSLTGVATGFDPASAMEWARLLFAIGAAAFALLIPVLAGFTAFAIADRPGLAPGFVGGAIAAALGTGFLGGIAAGLLGGFTALWVSRWAVPPGLRHVLPVVVTPLVSTLLTGAALVVVLGRPLRAVSTGLAAWLDGLAGLNLVVLGVVLGLMMGFDLGGPVNKVAYTFATAGLAATSTSAARGAPGATSLEVIAAVTAAGMTPPLGMALASAVRGRLFSEPERESGRAAWLLGASFITEGAIPFAVADPWRVIASSMAGSAVAGALVMAFGSTSRAPHGGIWVTPLIGSPQLFLLAVAAGACVTAGVVIALKSTRRAVAAEQALAGATEAAEAAGSAGSAGAVG
jgi:fructose PTS system EIIBC or EIIC component